MKREGLQSKIVSDSLPQVWEKKKGHEIIQNTDGKVVTILNK